MTYPVDADTDDLLDDLGYACIDLGCGQLASHRIDEIKAELIRRFGQTSEIAKDAAVGRKWREDSSLETWFPISAQERDRLRAVNATLFGAARRAVTALAAAAERDHEFQASHEELSAALKKAMDES